MENYLLNLTDLKELSLSEIVEKLKTMPGISLKKMTIENLVFYEDVPIYSGNGVYIFKEKEDFIYVGNCIARNFVERIPAHFDIRQGGWFHSLLANVIKKKCAFSSKTNETLTQAAKYAFENYNLILINFGTSEKRESMKKLETLLRVILNPYNNLKTKPFIGDFKDKLEKFV